MKRLHHFMLSLLAILTLTVGVQAQSIAPKPCTVNRLLVSSAMRVHFAFAASFCSDSAIAACNNAAEELKQDCEFRGEDGGTPYTSCKCQAARSQKNCFQNAGCNYGSTLLIENNPECFGIQ